MTEQEAIRYSIDAYCRAIHAGMSTSAASQIAIARFKTYYPEARESEIREKLAYGFAEVQIQERTSMRSASKGATPHLGLADRKQ